MRLGHKTPVPFFHMMYEIWFKLRQGRANKDASPNATITGEYAALPSLQSVLIKACLSSLTTPASVSCQLTRTHPELSDGHASNQEESYSISFLLGSTQQ